MLRRGCEGQGAVFTGSIVPVVKQPGRQDNALQLPHNTITPTFYMDGERIVAATLPVQQGCNHVLVKVVMKPAHEGETNYTLSLLLRTNQPDYLPQLRGT